MSTTKYRSATARKLLTRHTAGRLVSRHLAHDRLKAATQLEAALDAAKLRGDAEAQARLLRRRCIRVALQAGIMAQRNGQSMDDLWDACRTQLRHSNLAWNWAVDGWHSAARHG